MSASYLTRQSHLETARIAIFGGDGRFDLDIAHLKIETFASERYDGNGSITSLIAGIVSGRFDAVVFMVRWLGHSSYGAVKAACKQHDVTEIYCTGGASSARRKLERTFPHTDVATPDPVVLVDLFWTRDKDPRVPLGHASILAALRASGVRTVSIAEPVNDEQSDLMKAFALARKVAGEARNLGPNTIVALGVYVWAEHIVQLMLPALRSYGFTGKIVLGGPQISYSGDGLEQRYPDADLFVRGYGEAAMIAISGGEPARDIQGVHVAGEPDLVQQASVELSELPSPFLDEVIGLENQRFVRWETQRGCPYRCSFCQHREAGARLKWTDLEFSRLRHEIDMFIEAGVEDIAVLDPIFNVGKNAIPVLEALIERGYTGRISLQCRPEKLTDEFLELASQLNVCLEFGLQTIHKSESKAVKRANNMRKVDEALAKVRALDLDHEVSLIFALPEQTLESFYASVRWCVENDVPVIKAFPLLILRGSELEAESEKWGFETTCEPMGMVVSSNTFSDEDWFAMACLSEALKATEGEHPSFEELLALAEQLRPDVARWVASFEG